jgi:hypothetical protein
MKKTTACIFDVTELSPNFIIVMYQLFSKYYENTSFDIFERDLLLKDKVLLLGDIPEGTQKTFKPLDFMDKLVGFSSLSEREVLLDDKLIKIFFNGDTIIDPRYWGSNMMAQTWAKFFFRKKTEVSHVPFYWFLICSGHRTYRLLSSFFRDYYPAYGLEAGATRELKTILDRVALEIFGNLYDPDTNLIHLEYPTPLKKELLEITECKKLKPEIRYFTDLNHEHEKGVELACIAEISESNLSAAGKKLLAV